MQNTKLYAVFMISVMLVGIFSFFSVIALPSNSVTITSSGRITTVLPLHVDGTFIKDSSGNNVTLRGVNQVGFLDRPYGWWNPQGGGVYDGLAGWNPTAVQENLNDMKVWGFNTVRMHLNVEWWVQNVSTYNGYNMPRSYIQCIEDVIMWAGQRGMYVVIDFYSVQNGTGQDDLPYPPYSLNGSSVIIPDVNAFVNFWGNVSNELKNYPNVLFELWNEPAGNTTARDSWFSTAQQCINRIRSVGATQLIIVQWDRSSWINLDFPPSSSPAQQWAGQGNPASTFVWTLYANLSDTTGNLVWSLHMYDPFLYSNGSIAYTYDAIKYGMNITLGEYGNNTFPFFTKPIFIGEIGANSWWTGTRLQQEYSAFDNLLRVFNEMGISYTTFVWRETTTGLRYGLLQGTSYVPPPNGAGAIAINETNPNPFVFTVGTSPYIYSNNIPYTENWLAGNGTLQVTMIGNTSETGYLRVFWKYAVTSSLKVQFSNGTIVSVQNFFDNTTQIITLPCAFTANVMSASIFG